MRLPWRLAPAPSWGSTVSDARLHLFDSPHLVLFPAAAITCAALGFNFLGDGLRDQLDPRTHLENGVVEDRDARIALARGVGYVAAFLASKILRLCSLRARAIAPDATWAA